jgi:hypothetical protein
MNHIMLDLETLDSSPTSVIVSIGAVSMDLEKFKPTGDEYYRVIDPVSCQSLGLTLGAETVRWWLQQTVEARAIFRETTLEKVFSLPKALQEFTSWCTGSGFIKEIAMWGNGATFDNVILRNAYKACELEAPWSFRHDFCYRTMWRNFSEDQKYKPAGIKHNALDDARNQAIALIDIMRRLKK